MLAPVVLLGCHGSGAFAGLQQDLQGLSDGNVQILDKLETLQGAVDAIASAPQAAPSHAPKATPKPPRPGRPDPTATYKVAVDDAYTTGGKEALVTIVEWSDFQCPYCARVTPTMAALKEAYGDELRIAFKHNPLSFHDRAMPAAKAAEAAGRQGKFWAMHDKLFANNKALIDDNFAIWAAELQLDVAQFTKDLADKSIEEKIKKQQAQGMRLGARGTPAFFVNGRFLSGAQPVEAFKQIIDEEKKKAEAQLAKGTARAKVYDAVTARGKTKV